MVFSRNLLGQEQWEQRGASDARLAGLDTRLDTAELVTDFFYTHGFANGTDTSFTEVVSQNSVASLPYAYTMVVRAHIMHGGNGSANQVLWDVRDHAGVSCNWKGVTLVTTWDIDQSVNARILSTVMGKKDYAADVACGFRIAYRVNTSNVYADLGIHVQLVRR